MDKKLLTIAIPTYNRANYLDDLLNCIKTDLYNSDVSKFIQINIFDNASTDNTAQIVEKYNGSIVNLNYHVNEENSGADPNIYNCYTSANSDYVWVIGDDDLLEHGILPKVITCLKNEKPSLIIFSGCPLNDLEIFENYQDLANKYLKKDIRLLLCHTLISDNIIKTELFDKEAAKNNLEDLYGHMHGMLNNCITGNNRIILIKNGVLVRENRAPFADPKAYEIIPKKHYVYINKLLKKLHFSIITKFYIWYKILGWKLIMRSIMESLGIYSVSKDRECKHIAILGIKATIKRSKKSRRIQNG